MNVIWKRWLRVYLPELQKRSKWRSEKSASLVGDMILVMDDMAPRGMWPIRRVLEFLPGKDDLVRKGKLFIITVTSYKRHGV